MEPILTRDQIVGVVATGYAVRPLLLRRGIARLEAMGFHPLLGRSVRATDGYLAGNDDARFEDLSEMMTREDVAAIWFARGGFGTARLLRRLRPAMLRGRRPALIGYSDLSALFAQFTRARSRRCLYGPVVTELGDGSNYHSGSLKAALAGREQVIKLRPSQVWCAGRASGVLVGGNLSVLTSLCGTRFAPTLRGRILFLEDVGEPTYRLDRMLTQWRDAGWLRGLAGVLLGSFIVPPRRHFPPDRDPEEVLKEFFRPLGVPVVAGLRAGHSRGKRTLVFGAPAEIDTVRRRVILGP
ncbi:MAG: LD-carboxypeptidase [Acidobacteria bacterium]|nr:LD-carboxypeptidase [Acidobacteriota bacterium]NIM60552.1 LD-carboxypeptidase [Acidobacteriota bacterium]NIO59523.1 LD-carboxypeptidase [Acidobacteriota bacterium]NIQ30552.1 LD-carboxypeptidase [Acidobacteriota bacterium]NIQ85500.1 LD-carboxypeptidase [Acidobacteriota bacterium]